MENSSKLIVGKDFVICNICNFHAQNLGIHLKKTHKLDVTDYNGLTVSENSHTKYSENHFSYLTDAKEKNIDLSSYKNKMSISVSNAILTNPKEIKRRSELMSEINQTDLMKQKASETAIKTSARPEIIEQRTLQLKEWRKENPEDFYEKCVKPMINSFQSKPELKLFEFISLLDGFSFKRNQFVNSLLINNKSHNKQIDIGDKNKRIYIEFDGVLHFFPKFGEDHLINIKEKDSQLNQHIINHNWTLIRISYDQFVNKTNVVNKVKIDTSFFKKECLDEIIELLNANKHGVYKIGEAYV